MLIDVMLSVIVLSVAEPITFFERKSSHYSSFKCSTQISHSSQFVGSAACTLKHYKSVFYGKMENFVVS